MEYEAVGVLGDIELYFPSIVDDICNLETSTMIDEYIITLTNGDKMVYDIWNHSIRNLPSDSYNMSEDQCKREFGIRLKKIMNRVNVTQDELSERTGITQAMISRYICGTSSPSFYNTDKIAKALGCSVDEFRYI